MKISDVGCTFAEHADGDVVDARVLVAYGETGCNWKMTSHDCMSAPHVLRSIGHMHRATPAPGHPGGFAEQFRHHFISGDSTVKGQAMITICSDHTIARLTRRDQSRRNSLLSNVQVHETTNLAGLIQFRTTFLKVADQHHLAVEIQLLFFLHYERLRKTLSHARRRSAIVLHLGKQHRNPPSVLIPRNRIGDYIREKRGKCWRHLLVPASRIVLE